MRCWSTLADVASMLCASSCNTGWPHNAEHAEKRHGGKTVTAMQSGTHPAQDCVFRCGVSAVPLNATALQVPMPNHLIHESSPYLLQHANNPVNWYPWGPEALERAAREDKPILLSIGYAACHWCHVMERESFENEETAALMNELFVNIKVDR